WRDPRRSEGCRRPRPRSSREPAGRDSLHPRRHAGRARDRTSGPQGARLVTPFGDRAVRFTIPEGAPRRRLFTELSAASGVTDVVLAEEVGCVVFEEGVDRAEVARLLSLRDVPGEDATGTLHVIGVVYDGEDLDAVARAIGRSKEDVIALHSEREY